MKRALTLLAALALGACASREYTPHPDPPAARRSPANEPIELSVGIWEQIDPDPEILRVGGKPSYIETLEEELETMGLFRKVVVAPWRPGGTQVLLKITDAPRVDLHPTRTNWLMGTTVVFFGLPMSVLWYHADLDSKITLESVLPQTNPPLVLKLAQHSRLSGKALAFFGDHDARQTLSQRHSLTVARRIAYELANKRPWFEQLSPPAAAPISEAPVPPEKEQPLPEPIRAPMHAH